MLDKVNICGKPSEENEKYEMRCTFINYRTNSPDESVEAKLNSMIKVHVSCFSVLHVFVRSCQCLWYVLVSLVLHRHHVLLLFTLHGAMTT